MKARHYFVTLILALVGMGQSAAQNLVQNGDFEAGLSNWTTWAAAPSAFWDGVWLQSNDCDIWLPAVCPYSGSTSHAQKKGAGSGNAHGGLLQTLTVVPGTRYNVNGVWAGGVTGNAAGNGTWWEVVVYDGAVDAATIDAGVRPQDTLISKLERNNLGNNEVYQFQWTPFAGQFQAQSSTVTLVLKTGSYYTLDAAAYHDNIQVVAQAPITPVPALGSLALWLLALLLAALVVARSNLLRR